MKQRSKVRMKEWLLKNYYHREPPKDVVSVGPATSGGIYGC